MTPVGLLERSRQTTATFRQDRAVHLEGGLFGPDLLEQLASGDVPGQKPADFGLSRQANLLDEIAEAYRDACDLWQVFRRRLERLPAGKSSTTLTREGWVIPFLGLLGYELRYNQKPYDVNGVTYAVSHRAGENEDAPPVHITGAEQQLGRVNPHDPRRLSPHALLQEFLNRTDHLWGIVTNGLTLRLLRDSSYVRRQAYVEFDLQAIFEAEGDSRFADFVLLYRLLHRTRLPRGTADAHTCWLEQYHQRAIEQGNRARDRLRDGVEECLKILGTGFLRANPDWHPDPKDFYEQLLRLVYRFLFLLVAEERNLLGGSDLYRNHYSVSRLRRLIDRREAYTDHEDLWQSLRVLFYLLRNDTPQNDGKPLASFLELPVLDGGLFEPIDLDERTLTNRDLLQAFSYLAYYWDEDARTYRRVNYAALDVEELGSVYESLLDHHPVISNRTFEFATGTERKSTGSYYTPPELVAQLIHSALEPVIEERLAEVKQLANSEWRIVSSEWRSFPSLILERFYDHLQRLPRPGSVATRSGDRETSLPAHADLPAIGTLRDNQPDTPSSNFDPGQHRGGLGTSLSGRVYPVPPSGERQPHRTGDTSDHLLGNRTGQGGGYSAHPGCPDRPRSSDPQSGAQPPTEEELKSLWANLPFAIRYSLLSQHSILSIRVLDPACGSGHFLLAAARRLGKELARARTGEDEPSPEQVRESIRDVVAHCIYGVDKNPLAVELCKVALWIESQVPGKPLTFLDHRIRCGDSLVGVFDLEVLQRGIPDKAFDPVGDEDRALAREMKNNNRITRAEIQAGQPLLFGLGSGGDLTTLAEHARLIESIPDDSLETIREKGRRYNELRTEMNHLRTACDLWTASFFQRRTRSLARDARITSQTLCDWLRRGTAPQQAIAQAKALAHDHRFFHWPLEFPEVFSHGGVDVVISNPPYGALLSEDQKRFVKLMHPEVVGAHNSAAYFISLARLLVRPRGRVGLVIPKSLTYSYAWIKTRDLILRDLRSVVDIGRGWRDVLLEQVLLTMAREDEAKKTIQVWRLGAQGCNGKREVDSALVRRLGILPTGLTGDDITLLQTVFAEDHGTLATICSTRRGNSLQKFIEGNGDIPVLAGRDISEFARPVYSRFVSRLTLSEAKLCFACPGQAVFQNIIAHLTTPRDHVKLIGTLVPDPVLCLDTVSLIDTIDKKISSAVICSLLMSNFINWYVYACIYNRATRTMHFDNYFLSKIPLPSGGRLHYLKELESIAQALQENPKCPDAWKALNDVIYNVYGIPAGLREYVDSMHKPRWL